MFPLFLCYCQVGALPAIKQNTGHAIGMSFPEAQLQFCDRNENIHNNKFCCYILFGFCNSVLAA